MTSFQTAAAGDLVVVVDGEGCGRAPSMLPLAAFTVAVAASALRISSSDRPSDGDLRRIDLDAHRGLLLTADIDLRDAGDLTDLLRQHRLGEVVDLR